jgi:hypothetical protein
MVQDGITFMVIAEEVKRFEWMGIQNQLSCQQSALCPVESPTGRCAQSGILKTGLIYASICALSQSHATYMQWHSAPNSRLVPWQLDQLDSVRCPQRMCPPSFAQGAGRRVPFAFMEDISKRFIAAYGDSCRAVRRRLNGPKSAWCRLLCIWQLCVLCAWW